MIKLLYSNGCSMTEGSELGNRKFNYDETTVKGPNTSRATVNPDHAAYMEAHAYPAIVARNLNIPSQQNGALCGSSNARIVRTTISDVEELCKQYDPSELFVLVGFSNTSRFEHYANNKFQQVVNQAPRNKFGFGNIIEHDLHKYFRLKIEIEKNSVAFALAEHFVEVLTLKQYLESKNIKFLFSYGLVEHFGEHETPEQIDVINQNKEIQTLFSLCEYDNPKVWIVDVVRSKTLTEFLHNTTSYSFFDYTVRRRLLSGYGGHPLEQAHETWATHITQFITKNNIL